MNISSRDYKRLSIDGAALIKSRKYTSRPDGWVREQADFPEMTNILGFRFDPRCLFTIWSPNGLIRGGHMEGRSRLATIVRGAVFIIMVDTRPGDNQSKVETFYLGDHEKAWGDTIIVPEGVIMAYFAVSDDCYYLAVGNRPYNKFDSQLTLDIFDPKLKIEWPEGINPDYDDDEDELLPLEDFIEKL